MKPSDLNAWRKADAAFAELVELPPEERAEAARDLNLDAAARACLEQLLNASESSGVLDGDSLLQMQPEASGHLSGQRLGQWLLEDEIGRGGMAVVYAATREESGFVQHAAIKILPRGMTGRERFEQERSLLAKLDHTNIARFIDGGVGEDGSPWLAMDLIQGEPITDYCRGASDQRKVKTLMPVIDAVAYAHRHLVVHRDLKPSNILVNQDGHPFLLDFGIAKLLSDDQAQGATRAMTPGYAAPEQMTGDEVSTATDVFGLGAVLHALITGNPPRDSEQKASRQLASAPIDQDLRNIIEKALRDNPQHRYPTAQALATDLVNWRSGQPVEATAGSQWYRFRKWLVRHRAAASAAGAIALVLLVGSVVVAWQARETAEKAQTVEAQNAVLRELLESPQTIARGRQARVIDVLADAAPTIQRHLPQASIERANLYRSIAITQHQLGDSDHAIEMYRNALADADQLQAYPRISRVRVTMGLGRALAESGHLEEGLALIESAIETATNELPENNELRAELLSARMVALARAGDSRLEAALEEAVAIADTVDWRVPEHRAFFECSRLQALIDLGRFDDTVALSQSHIDWAKATFGDRHSHTLCGYQAAVTALSRTGQSAEAERMAHEAEKLSAAWLGSNDHIVFIFKVARANAIQEQGRNQEAIAINREILANIQEVAGLTFTDRLMPRQNLANALMESGQYDAAQREQAQVVRLLGEIAGSEHPQTLMAQANLAEFRVFAGKANDALQPARSAFEGLRAALGPEHPVTLFGRSVYGGALAMSGDSEAALEQLSGTPEQLSAVFGDTNVNVFNARFWLATALAGEGRYAEAETELQRYLPFARNHWGKEHARVKRAESLLAAIQTASD